jgi:hypothetical protein
MLCTFFLFAAAKFIRMFLMCFEEVIAPITLFIDLRDFFFVGTDSRAERIVEIFTDWIKYNPTTVVDNADVCFSLSTHICFFSFRD